MPINYHSFIKFIKQSVLFAVIFTLLIVTSSVSAQNSSQDAEYYIERLKNHSDQTDYNLDEQKSKAIVQNCNNHKKIIAQLQDDNNKAVGSRIILYSGIQKELKALEIRISKQGADASEIDLLIGKIDQLLEDLQKLEQKHTEISLGLRFINCTEDQQLYGKGVNELRNIRSLELDKARELTDAVKNAPQTTFMPLIERLLI